MRLLDRQVPVKHAASIRAKDCPKIAKATSEIKNKKSEGTKVSQNVTNVLF